MMCQLLTTFWYLWYSRNMYRIKNSHCDPTLTATRIRILSAEFWKLNSAHPASWPGFLKINADAAWDPSSGEGDVAGIARNDVGVVIAIRCKHFLRVGSALEAEGIAILEGFCLAQDLNCSKYHLATDCLNAYDALYTCNYGVINTSLWYTRCRRFLISNPSVLLLIRREVNVSVDSLAHFSRESKWS
ncbi:hypothetical protein QQ045_030665 [Rhodiola kirilowii]